MLIPERATQSILTQSEMAEIERYEENERRMAEEDFGSDIDGILDAYDSEEDWSFEYEAEKMRSVDF
jgi:hypothetical protein